MHSSLSITFLTTILSLIAFAANSIFCRLALGDLSIDPTSFTAVRMLSGALTLFFIVYLSSPTKPKLTAIYFQSSKQDWFASIMLFSYAAFFSFAYIKLDTASGALVLFATVQLSMLGIGLFSGHRLNRLEWIGLFISVSGFIGMMLPNATQPPIIGMLLMIIAGISWAIYTLNGQKKSAPSTLSQSAIEKTAYHFFRTVPLSIGFIIPFYSDLSITMKGVLLALASGSLASAMGYSLWYYSLKGLTITQAAISQLAVPVIAAIGGVLFIAESISVDFIIASFFILGGIAMVGLSKKQSKRSSQH